MQSMFATVGSLLAGSAIAVPFSTTFDEIVEAETRLAGQDNGGLASLILWAPLTSAGVGFVAAMVTIKISLSLYIALAACNFPEKGALVLQRQPGTRSIWALTPCRHPSVRLRRCD